MEHLEGCIHQTFLMVEYPTGFGGFCGLDQRRVLQCYRGNRLCLPHPWSSFFGWNYWTKGHSLTSGLEGEPCTSYVSSMRAYFSILPSILEKSIYSLFSNGKRKEQFCSPLFIVVIVTVWSRLYTSIVIALNRLIYDLRDSYSPYLMLTRKSEP